MTAVDSSKRAIETFRNKNLLSFQNGRLKIIESTIETFTPEQPADLVIASDVLPYMDPYKFQETWTKIHDECVKPGGVFIGSLFLAETDPAQCRWVNRGREMGARFLPDKRMVRALLTKTGYEVDTCRFAEDAGVQNRAVIRFRVRKKAGL